MRNISVQQSGAYSLQLQLRQEQFICSRHSSKFHLQLWVVLSARSRFSQAALADSAWKRSTAMREKGHQNWPLVIRPRYDPHLPFSERSVSKPWSKRDTSSSPLLLTLSPPSPPPTPGRWVSLTVPLQSLPVSQEAQTKACLSAAAETGIQHIFMRLSGISCFVIMKERIVWASQTWDRATRKWFGAVTLLSRSSSVSVLAAEETEDAAQKPLPAQAANSQQTFMELTTFLSFYLLL